VNAHVQDGRIVRISTDPRKWTPEMPPLPACVRGFDALERVYHPERLLHPLRRTGPRGANQWERITWADALDEVAGQIRRVRETYGPAAILDAPRSGYTSLLHNRLVLQRFLYLSGGYLVHARRRGTDTRGCANVPTADRSAPSGASTYNTCQVEVEPAL
jgi:anaerobic dimethyl sulfoxide reductase subunit A